MVLTRLTALIRWMWNNLVRYALKFGVVGLVGFFTDVIIFNVLRATVFDEPIVPNIISVAIATIVTWFGNRYWTFREHRRKNYVLELIEFTAVCLGGILISLACLYVSHYVLGFQSLLADNISSNGIGLVLSTLFRFFLYRFWVYGHHRADGLTARRNKAEAAALAIFEDDSSATRTASRL